MNLLDPVLQQFQEILSEAKQAIVFTGAGVSTESGIPDFRSPGGIWTKHQPITFQDFLRSETIRHESWKRKFATDTVVQNAKPNPGHIAITSLIRKGIVCSVITQNIDGLHQIAGVPDEKLIELHGNATYASCLDCHKRVSLKEIRIPFEAEGHLPVCVACGGIVKTATISFGQPMPESAMLKANKAASVCDLFVVVGSSLVVYPAAGFPIVAKQNGAKLIILNRDPTDLDELADLVINREIGPTLAAVTNTRDV